MEDARCVVRCFDVSKHLRSLLHPRSLLPSTRSLLPSAHSIAKETTSGDYKNWSPACLLDEYQTIIFSIAYNTIILSIAYHGLISGIMPQRLRHRIDHPASPSAPDEGA